MGHRRTWAKAWKAVTTTPTDPAGYAALAAAEAAMSRSAGTRPLTDAAQWHADAAWAWMGLHLALADQPEALLAHTTTRPAWTAATEALVSIATKGLSRDRLYTLYYALLSAGVACEAADAVADLADSLED